MTFAKKWYWNTNKEISQWLFFLETGSTVLRDGTSWCGRRGGAGARLFGEGDRLGPSPSSLGDGGSPSSPEEREFESRESGGEASGFSWFSPKIYPPELYPGPMIQSIQISPKKLKKRKKSANIVLKGKVIFCEVPAPWNTVIIWRDHLNQRQRSAVHICVVHDLSFKSWHPPSVRWSRFELYNN